MPRSNRLWKQPAGVAKTSRLQIYRRDVALTRESGQITQEEHAEYEQKLANAWKQKNKAAVAAHNAVAKDYATKVQGRAKPANIHQVAAQSVPDERRFVQNLMGSLTPQERRVLELYHFDKLTMEDIGDVLSNEDGLEKGYTRARIQQIHASAIGKIKLAAAQLGVPPERIDAYFGSENNSLQGGADVQTVSSAELTQSGAAMHTPGAATNPSQQGGDSPIADAAGNQELGEEAGLVGEFGDSDQFDEDPGERNPSRVEEVTTEDDGLSDIGFSSQVDYLGRPIRQVDIEDALEDWSGLEDIPLHPSLVMQWAKLWIAHEDGVINDRRFKEQYLTLAEESENLGRRNEEASGNPQQPGRESAERTQGRKIGRDESAGSPATQQAQSREQPRAQSRDQTAGSPEEGVATQDIIDTWDDLAEANNLPPFDELAEDQRQELLNAYDSESLQSAVDAVAGELQEEAMALGTTDAELDAYENLDTTRFSIAAARDKLKAELSRWKGVVAEFLGQRLDRTKTHTLLTSTPASMQAMGLPNQEVRIGVHALDYLDTRLTRDQLEDLPNQLANPQMVYIHVGVDGPSINFVTDKKNGSGQLVIALKPNQYTRESSNSHFVATIVNVQPQRIVSEFRNGHGVYVANKDMWPGLREAITTSQNKMDVRPVRYVN